MFQLSFLISPDEIPSEVVVPIGWILGKHASRNVYYVYIIQHYSSYKISVTCPSHAPCFSFRLNLIPHKEVTLSATDMQHLISKK